MDNKRIPMWKLKVKTEAERIRRAFKDTVRDIWEFCKDNPAEAAAIAGSGAIIARKAVKAHEINAEDRRRRKDFYDPRSGDHVITKRPLTPKQKVEVDRRRREDEKETYVHIFDDMGIKFK